MSDAIPILAALYGLLAASDLLLCAGGAYERAGLNATIWPGPTYKRRTVFLCLGAAHAAGLFWLLDPGVFGSWEWPACLPLWFGIDALSRQLRLLRARNHA